MPQPPIFHQVTRWALPLAFGILSAVTVRANPPDLTAPGVIAGIDRTYTYNLGPTGLRGWIYVNRANVGDSGLMTDLSRQILVTTASAPANAVLQTDDVILGAVAAASGTVPNFSGDCRKAFATATGDAEKTGAGTLRVKRWRAGVTEDVNISIPILGDYSATAPFDCPKSSTILANARDQMVGELLANSNYLVNDYAGAIHGLALLASVAPGDPNHATVQTRLQTYARARANEGPLRRSLPIWDWSYSLLFLSEYYLLTGDSQVVAGIHNFTLTLAESQSIYGTYGHSESAIRPDGTGRRVSIGYGPVNSVGVVANIALVMGKKALQAASQSIDPEIDSAIERGSNFFAFYVNKGSIPYGEHEPVAQNHASNGKDPMTAVFFGLQPDRQVETEYFTRMSIAGWIGREYGHTGQGFSYLWATLGAHTGGPHAAAEHLRNIRWHLDLSRRSNGSFAYDGQEQYGGGTTSNGTYLGKSDHYGMNPTAIYLLTYSLPLQRLFITGKNANPANTLGTAKVANAVAAATFRLDRTSMPIAQLFAALGEYDPVVRHFAAVELAARSLGSGDLTNLRNLLASPDSNIRQSACQALGLRQDTTALPTIVGLLNDPDLWVRAKAASAIRSYTSATASTHRDAMINAFVANATDPNVIDWSDPIQMSNGRLSLALFGNAVPDGSPGNNIAAYTINAPKQTHLFPALRAGLRQPDSYPRVGVAKFARDRLPLADVQALYPEIVDVAAYDTPADRMWSGDCRAEAIRLLGNLKVTEGIPLALAMLEVPENFGWGSGPYLVQALTALASYGDAARYTLPTLRGYLSKWNPSDTQYTTLVNTINTIENAITAPARNPGLCVANSQIVATTGARAISLTGLSPRAPGTVSYLNLTQPAHGTLTGTAPNLTYTPDAGYTGPDKFTFQTTDTLTTSAVATVAIIVGPAGNGLMGEYYDNADFTNLKLTRTDSQINFDWGTGSPHASIGADTFSVRWSGVLLVPESGHYTFSALTSDGVRVYVNGQLVIDNFVNQNTRWTDGNPIYLSAGQLADLYVEYYENTGTAVARLQWTGPSFAGLNGDIIPQAYLFDGSGIANRPAFAFPQNLTTNRNTALPVSLNGSGGTLAYTVLTPPANGTLSGTAPNLTYTPHANFSGTDSFAFIVNNGATNSLPATVSISVQAGALTQFTWSSATSGSWSDAARWTPGVPAAAGQSNYALNFTPSGTYTATHDLTSGFQLNQLNAASTVTIDGTQSMSFVANGASQPQFNQNSGNQVTVNAPVNLAAVTNFGGSNSGNVTLTNQITGSGGILKTNPGRLVIHGINSNNFSGGTVVNNGTLHLGAYIGGTSYLATNPLGSGPVTLNGATIQFERVTASHPLVVNGGTLFSNNGWGATWSGPVTLNHTLNARCNWPLTLSGSISGNAGIVKTGTNELRLTVANSYTGTTDVTDGTVVCSHASALGTGPLIITAPAKVTLNYTGTRVIASLTLDGTLMPPGTYGSSTSTATYKNNTYFSGNGTLTVPQPTSTALALTSGSTPADPGMPLTFTATVGGTSPTGSVQFFSGTTLLGTGALNGSFQASFTTNQLAIGPHEITARYVGNATNAPSTSPAMVIEVNNTPVSPPANLTATPALTQINLAWTASGGATGYYVKRSTTPEGPYSVIALVTGTNYQDTAIQGGATYHYLISAINAAGESGDSHQASAFIGPASSTYTSLSSSPADAGVYGTSVIFTAAVTAVTGTPDGTVTFRSDANVIGSETLSAGTASMVISTLAVGVHSITASYDGVDPYDPSTSAALAYEVTPKPLTITGVTAANKPYDGTATAALSGGSLTGGTVGGETVTFVAGSGAFASANAGTWAVSAAGYALAGSHAANYSLTAQPTVPNATIVARPVHLTGTKTYDGTASAPADSLMITNNLDAGNLNLNGIADLTSKDAGERAIIQNHATPVRVQSGKGNTGSSANTTLRVTLPAAPSDGNSLIAVISTRGTSASRVSGITGGGATWSRVAQATNTSGSTTEIWYGPGVSSGTTDITITQASLRSAAVVIEYSGLLAPASLDVAASNTGSGTTASTGTTAPTSQANEVWIGGIGIAGSSPTLSAITNNFTTVDNAASTRSVASSNARIYALERIVTATGAAATGGTLSASAQWSGAIATFRAATSFSLTGSAAANYTLAGMTSSFTVTPKALDITGLSASDRTYNGTTAAPLAGTPAMLAAQAPGTGTANDGKPYTGDAVGLEGTAAGSFATKHADPNKPVTVTGLGLSGAQAANYTLNPVTGLAASVTPLPVTVSAIEATKTYDGTTTAPGTPLIEPDLAPGDTATVLAQAFETATAGISNKTILPAIAIDDGNGGANYDVTLVNITSGTIHKAEATVTLGNLTHIHDATPKSASVTTDPPGLSVTLAYDGSPTPPTNAGTYAVVATVEDDNFTGSASDDLIIAWQSAFDQWVAENGGQGQGITFSSDANGDALADGLAWLLGAESPSQNARDLLPAPLHENGAFSIAFYYLVAARRGSATLRLQISANLGADSWTDVAIPDESATVDGVAFIVTPVPGSGLNHIQATISSGDRDRIFVRLNATDP